MRRSSGPLAPVRSARSGVITASFAVVALGTAIAPAAHAAQPATADQTAAIATAVGMPANCITAQISTVDPTWATAQDTNVLPCAQADGVVIVNLVGGVWKTVTSGSDFGFCPITGVPDAVSAEFKLCTPVTPAAYVLGSSSLFPKGGVGFGDRKPRTLFNGGAPVGEITAIHWSHWGSATATATATGRIAVGGGKTQKLVRVGVKLRALDPSRCDAQPAYSRVQERAPRKHGGPLGAWFPVYGIKDICPPADRTSAQS